MNSSPSLQSLSHPLPKAAARRRVPPWVIPAAIAAGFALLFLALFRDRLLPAPLFEVAPVLAVAADADNHPHAAAGGGAAFQASGWLEPDPLPVMATALVDGVIATVHVLEGQLVAKGDPLATLVDDDARLALAAAVEHHRTLAAAREAQLAAITTARRKREAATAAARGAQAVEDEAADRHARLSKMKPGSIPEGEVVAARLQLDGQRQQREAAEAECAAAGAEIIRLEAESKVREAEVAAAAVAVEQARLALDRTRIVAPVDGRVLRLLAAPGQKKRLGMDDPDSATVAILYQPERLQVRVDVPLADAAGLSVGQRARIHCSLLPDRVFDGEVTRIVGEADVQRNTLQAKVRVVDPDDQLRPEMLCRVEFSASAAASGGASGSLALWVPAAAVSDGAAWVCDPDSRRVARRALAVSGEVRDGFVRVTDGLRPGELVVLSPVNLRDGRRVNPRVTRP